MSAHVIVDDEFSLAACQSDITQLAVKLGAALAQRGHTVSTAESCTGGGIAEAITRIAGSSRWFELAWITYSNQAKIAQLKVSRKALLVHGAVSEAVVHAMATAACAQSGAQWSMAVSGIAGPDGGSAEKPVGLVCFAWAGPLTIDTETRIFQGNREAVRAQTVRHALQQLLLRVVSSATATPVP